MITMNNEMNECKTDSVFQVIFCKLIGKLMNIDTGDKKTTDRNTSLTLSTTKWGLRHASGPVQ